MLFLPAHSCRRMRKVQGAWRPMLFEQHAIIKAAAVFHH